MSWLSSKRGILIVAFIGLFVFASLAISGVFGSTQLGLTLRTNASLNNGLVGHWTFDSTDVNGFTVRDSSGNGNDGAIVATTSASVEVEIDDSTDVTDREWMFTSASTVWVSDQEGYVFFLNGSGSGLHVASTTDGGDTWQGTVQIDSNSQSFFAIWYDRWTPSDTTGNYIHIGSLHSSDDEMQYTRFDTITRTLSTTIAASSGNTTTGSRISAGITKAENGDLYITAFDSDDAFTLRCGTDSDCTSGSSWSEIGQAYDSTSSDQPSMMLPVAGTNDIMLVTQYGSASDIRFNRYSATSSSWWGNTDIVTGIEAQGTVDDRLAMLSAAVQKNTGKVYVSLIDDHDDFSTQDHDIDVWQFVPSTNTWTELTSPVTNASGGIEATKILLDENRENHIYVAYIRRTTIGDASTANIYYRLSTDGGTTWSAEIGPLNGTEQDIAGLGSSHSSNERLSVSYKYTEAPEQDDFYVKVLADIGDYADEKVVAGNLGQGMEFDGVDDYVQSADSPAPSSEATISAWVNLETINQPSNPIIFATDTGAAGLRMRYVDGGSLWFRTYGLTPDTFTSCGNCVSAGEWTHVTMVYTGTHRFIYVNGILVASEEATGTISSGSQLNIGGFSTGNNFAGVIDDVRIYDRAFSTTSVQRLYQLGATTKINKTLNTNPDLENGLIGHWSFDATDVDGFTVSDRSSSGNDGGIIATSTQGEVEIDADGQNTNSEHFLTAPTTFWVNDQVGYHFYESTGQDFAFSSTTDGGATWGPKTEYYFENGTKGTMWYDGWTEGVENPNTVHILIFDTFNDELGYIQMDVAAETFSTPIEFTSGDLGNAISNYQGAISQSRNGTVFATLPDNTGSVTYACESDCTATSSWVSIASPYGSDAAGSPILQPVYGTDNMLLFNFDNDNELLEANVYSATSSSWFGARTLLTGVSSLTNDGGQAIGLASNQNTGEAYIVSFFDVNDDVTQDHDIIAMKLDTNTLATTSLTNVVTNASGGLEGVKIVLDPNREGHLYVVYNRKTTISDNTTINVYYKVSYDDGLTWSSELGPINTEEADMQGPHVSFHSDERITAAWWYESAATNANDIQITTIADIGDYEDEKVTTGAIGQGMKFDGVDDYVEMEGESTYDLSSELTIAAWIKTESNDTSYAAIMTKGDTAWRLSKFGTTDNIYFAVTGASPTDIAGSVDVTDGAWHHVVGTYDGSDMTLYIDGEVDATQSSTGAASLNNFNVAIGGNLQTPSILSFDGEIDDARVYNRSLSAAEVKRLYQLGATTKVNTTIDTNPDLKRGLAGHWTFDGEDVDFSSTSAEILDRSGNNRNGDYNFVSIDPTTGIMGQAMRFNQSDDAVQIEEFADAEGSEITVSAWINPGVDGLGYMIASKARSGAVQWEFQKMSGDNLRFDVENESGTEVPVAGSIDLQAGRWHHVVGVYDGANVSIYVDGVFDNSAAQTGSIENEDNPVCIGASSNAGNCTNNNFDGKIDDVRIYNRALSTEEILRLYQLGGN